MAAEARPAKRCRRYGSVLRPRLPLLIVGLLLALMWGALFALGTVQKQRLLDEAQRSLWLTNRAMTAQTGQLLAGASGALHVLDDWLRTHPQADPAHDPALRELADALARAQGGLRLALLDPDRRLHAPGDAAALPWPVHAADASSDPDTARLGMPRPDPATGRDVLPLSLPRPGGGALLALIDLGPVLALHEHLRARPSGSVALARRDGMLLTRVPPLPGLVGKTAFIGNTAAQWQPLKDEIGGISEGIGYDNVRRVVTAKRVPGYPMVVVVTQGYDDALALFRQRYMNAIETCSATSIGALVLAVVLMRAQRRERLRSAELAAVSEAAPIGIFRTDTEGRIVYANEAYLAMQGVERERMADGWLQLVPAAEREAVWASWRQQIRQAQPVHATRSFTGPDGSLRWVTVRSNPLYLGGRLAGHVGTVKDITEETVVQDERERNEAVLRAMADGMQAMISVIDREQRLRFFNHGFMQWTGATRESMLGRTLREALGEARHARAAPWIARALAGEHAVFDVRDDDGPRHRFLHVTYLPLRLSGGSEVDRVVIIAEDRTERRLEEARLMEMARIDPLTGALNRAGFEQVATEAAARSDGRHLALLCIDLDHFKAVNDAHGHPVGDELLRVFVKRLRHLMRPSDALGRLGGDEFVVLLQQLKATAAAEQVAEKVVAAAAMPFRLQGHEIVIGASVGVAVWQADGSGNWSAHAERADGLLYRAKKAGRGRVGWAGATLVPEAVPQADAG